LHSASLLALNLLLLRAVISGNASITCCLLIANLKYCSWKYRSGFSMSLNLSELMVAVKLNANRNVVGVLRGFDQFMNLVLDNTLEVNGNDTTEIGMVVSVPTSVSLSSFSIDTQFTTVVGSCIFASTGFLQIVICIILIVH
jgi:small nuclear ribonucleoprotein G